MRTASIFPTDADHKSIINGGPFGVPIAKTYDASLNTATDITLNTLTSYVEVAAIDKAVLLRYQATASTSNFDAVIPANSVRGFAVPSGVTVISVIEEQASAHVVVTEY